MVAADVYGVAPHTGRGGWTWYTGSAGWLYRLIVESLLGISLEGERLHFTGAAGRLKSFTVHYRYRDTPYHITVRAADNGEASLAMDGVEMEGQRFHSWTTGGTSRGGQGSSRKSECDRPTVTATVPRLPAPPAENCGPRQHQPEWDPLAQNCGSRQRRDDRNCELDGAGPSGAQARQHGIPHRVATAGREGARRDGTPYPRHAEVRLGHREGREHDSERHRENETLGGPPQRGPRSATPERIESPGHPASAMSATPAGSGAPIPGGLRYTRPIIASRRPIHSRGRGRSPPRSAAPIMVSCTAPNSTSAPVPSGRLT